MKIRAEIGGEMRSVELNRDGRKLTAIVDGRSYEADISEPEINVFLLKIENRINEAVVSPDANNSFHVRLRENEFDIRIIDQKRLRGSETNGEAGEGISELKTAMPGKVVRIIAQVNSEVKKGDGVIVVEAMKMQNELKAPKGGIIAEIRVAEGDNVNPGDILAIIE